MKRAMILVFPMLLVTSAATALLARQVNFPDIAGTWVGETDFPATPDRDPVTMVLKKVESSFGGTIAVGKAKEVTLQNVKIEDDDTFSFEFSLTLGGETNTVKARLDVLNDKLAGTRLLGSWTMEDGSYGTLELQPKK